MAELATIARPYAEALFKASSSDLNGAAVWVEALQVIANNPQLQQYADNPNVSATQVFDVIVGVAQVALPDMAKNFLRTVIENGRMGALPEIAEQFRVLKNAQSGSADAVVYSAFAIDSAGDRWHRPTLRARRWPRPQRRRPRAPSGRRTDA